jgi:hypothetical protein
MSYSNPFYPTADGERSPQNRTPSVIRHQLSNNMERTNSFSANDESKSISSNSFRITFQSDNNLDVDSTRNGSHRINSPMDLSPIAQKDNSNRPTAPFGSNNHQNFTSASKFRKQKTDISIEPINDQDSQRMSRRTPSRMINQENLSNTQSIASLREVSPRHSPHAQAHNNPSRHSKSGRNIPSLQNVLPSQSFENLSQRPKSPNKSREYPITKTYQTFGLQNPSMISNSLLKDRDSNLDFQTALNQNAALKDELAACKTQMQKFARLFEESRSNEEKLIEKVTKYEAVIKSIREENRELRAEVQHMDFIVSSNQAAEEMATKYEEERHHNNRLMQEIEQLRGSLQESRQAYTDLVNEFNRTKLSLIKSKRSFEALPTSTLVSNHHESKPFLSKTSHAQSIESAIVNNDIKRMHGSLNDETLNSIYAGTSDILKQKVDDSCFNYPTPNGLQRKENVGPAPGHSNPSRLSSREQRVTAQAQQPSPLLSGMNPSFGYEYDDRSYTQRY